MCPAHNSFLNMKPVNNDLNSLNLNSPSVDPTVISDSGTVNRFLVTQMHEADTHHTTGLSSRFCVNMSHVLHCNCDQMTR